MRALVLIAQCGFLLSFVLAAASLNDVRADEPKPVHSDRSPESGKLLATAGVSQIEGAGGGGLVPWALITGYGTRDAVGGNAHYSYVHTSSFDLHSGGAAVGLYRSGRGVVCPAMARYPLGRRKDRPG